MHNLTFVRERTLQQIEIPERRRKDLYGEAKINRKRELFDSRARPKIAHARKIASYPECFQSTVRARSFAFIDIMGSKFRAPGIPDSV